MTSRAFSSSLLLAVFFFGVAGEATAAAAPDTNACIEAFDRGQRARTDKKLRTAQSELIVCTQESCPVVLRADCAGVLRQVQAGVPSIVLAADDGEGHDITDVTVSVGGNLIASKIDGHSLEFDPGTYAFTFERPGGEEPRLVVIHDVLREGEKNRVVRASFIKKKPVVVAPPPPRRSTVGYAVPIGVGVLGLAAAGFALVTKLGFNSDVDGLRHSCSPNCTETQRDDLSSTLVRANVSLGIGIGLVVAAGVSWFFLGPSAASPSPARAARAASAAGSAR